ncbi:sulfatase-like hydrolase/transferase [Candidatus Bathyarchaeota archaeon]|nr:sulfatase-like hydrolase/transferase [Candidatus Bathyarchaeota archaeon]
MGRLFIRESWWIMKITPAAKPSLSCHANRTWLISLVRASSEQIIIRCRGELVFMQTFLIIVDSWRKDHCGCYGNPWIETPHLDTLARDSVIFDFAYPESLPTLPVRRVLHTGKRTFPFKHNVKEGYKGDPVKANGWGPIPAYHTTLAEYFHMFNVCAFITDTYHQFKPSMNFHRGYHYWEWVRGQEVDPWGTADPLDKCKPESLGKMMLKSRWVGPPDPVPDWSQMKRYQMNMAFQQQTEADYLAARLFKTAADWVMKNAHHGHKIFCCVDSFSPHEPFDAPITYRNHFLEKEKLEKRTPEVISREENLKKDWPGIPLQQFTHHHLPSMKWARRFPPGAEISNREIIWPAYDYTHVYSEQELRYLRASYASLVEFTDRWLGYFINALKHANLYDDAAIVVISDHGHQLGEHGCIGKMANKQFPNLNDLILLVKLPNQQHAGTRDQRLVSNAEIFPTIMEFKGYRIPENVDGFPLFVQEGDFGPWKPTIPRQRNVITCGFTHQVMAFDKRWYYMTTTEREYEMLWDVHATPAMDDTGECSSEHPEILDDMWEEICKVMAGESVNVDEESSQKWYDMNNL